MEDAIPDGRPDVYTLPLDERSNMSSGRRRLVLNYGRKDRLLLALRLAHGQARYDLVNHGH